MHITATDTAPKIASALSADVDWARASRAVAAACADTLGARTTELAVLFVSRHHTENLEEIAKVVASTLSPGCLLGVAAESVIGDAIELENAPGISLLAASLPGATLKPFTADEFLPVDETDEGLMRLRRAVGADQGRRDLRAVFLFADQFSTPTVKLMPALSKVLGSEAHPGARSVPVVGGMASAGRSPGGNALYLDGKLLRAGVVGVGIRGPVRVDAVVSQGCRAFGPNMVVTKARGNIIFQLGGHPALEAVQHAIEDLPEEQRPLLEGGLFLGRVINEYKDRFGRSDYLIRNLLGVDKNSGALAVGDMIRVGQTVRLHVRDSTAATEDLALLLDAQQLHERPAGALLITCNGRGTRLFPAPHHDAAAIVRAFRLPEGGEERAKGGRAIDPQDRPLPLAGMFANGEIGPIGGQSFLHGHTVVAALFRSGAELPL